MKNVFLIVSFLLIAVSGFGQSNKLKTKTKTTATAPAKIKPAAPKPFTETAEQKAAREKMVTEKTRALTENMSKNLGLSVEQYTKVRELNMRSINEVEIAKLRYMNDLPKMNEEIQNIGGSRIGLLKDILTPQQFEKYNQKRAEKMGMPENKALQNPKNPMPGTFDQ